MPAAPPREISSTRQVSQQPALSIRADFERDIEDGIIFVKEFLLVFWRCNPIAIAAHDFKVALQAAHDQASPEQFVDRFGSSLNALDLPDPETFSRHYSSFIVEYVGMFRKEALACPVRAYPQLENFIDSHLPEQHKDIAADFSQMTYRAIDTNSHRYVDLKEYTQLLRINYPRFSQLTKPSIFGVILSLGLACLGGPGAAVGAHIWSNLKTSDDEEFQKNYAFALDSFQESCSLYLHEVEQSLAVILERVSEELREIASALFDLYASLEVNGWDINPIYESHRTPSPYDEEVYAMAQVVFDNLEKNAAVSYRTIKNLKMMMSNPPETRPDHDMPVVESDDTPPPLTTASPSDESALDPKSQIHQLIREATLRFSSARLSIQSDTLSGATLPIQALESINRAIKSFAPFSPNGPRVKQDDVLLLWDNSLIQNGKSGILLSNDALYWKSSMFDTPHSVSYDSIANVTIIAKGTHVSRAEITVNSQSIKIDAWSPEEMDKAAAIITSILTQLMPVR